MPTLVVIADNICGSSSDFILLGQEPKDPPEPNGGRVLVDLTQQFHTVVTIAGGPIAPGGRFSKEVELDYDLRSLQWVVPRANRNRFNLRVLR